MSEVALIVGGASGIGLESAIAPAERQHIIALADESQGVHPLPCPGSPVRVIEPMLSMCWTKLR